MIEGAVTVRYAAAGFSCSSLRVTLQPSADNNRIRATIGLTDIRFDAPADDKKEDEPSSVVELMPEWHTHSHHTRLIAEARVKLNSTRIQRDADAQLVLRVCRSTETHGTGRKMWDASLLMASWVAENRHLAFPPPPGPGERPSRVLELGAGLGLVGLTVAKLLPHARVTLSDNDPQVIAGLAASVALNFESPDDAARVSSAELDFCAFTRDALEDAAGAVGGPLRAYAGLLHSFDVIVGSDVVYNPLVDPASLARACAALLAHPRPNWQPRAIFCLPSSRVQARQSLAAFAKSLAAEGLRCRTAQVDQSCGMEQRLRRANPGWGLADDLAFYFVTRP